jgi:hypothetical protein
MYSAKLPHEMAEIIEDTVYISMALLNIFQLIGHVLTTYKRDLFQIVKIEAWHVKYDLVSL